MFDKKANSCIPCPLGYFGINCLTPCPQGNNGNGCQSLCPGTCRNTCNFITGKCLQPGNRRGEKLDHCEQTHQSLQTIIEKTTRMHAGPQPKKKYFSNSIIVIIVGSVFVFMLTVVLIYNVQKILRKHSLRKNQDQRGISLSLTEDAIYQQINENVLYT
ncbi:multiple epidermal growth factor-like domains protein 10 [Saccostrea echinata]|uniref:multiple epidermal growth factor-like domains protein 10 n=1 Tax=Saccostrea echinata TaxID=191078 RepID=UPI002A823C23|nr:multiple epidermal growth factor-like domains protein 10 [Saccostrea echinata]